MTQDQAQKSTQDEAPQEVEPVALQDESLSDEVDDLLADIDEILGEQGEEFALEYRQLGGQ